MFTPSGKRDSVRQGLPERARAKLDFRCTVLESLLKRQAQSHKASAGLTRCCGLVPTAASHSTSPVAQATAARQSHIMCAQDQQPYPSACDQTRSRQGGETGYSAAP
ncbi:hypothetical protein KFL_010250040 [Klebsormidium nitens]|uniref:Uncharacterized protein n=1 Tax=Klebsormidium nitens TaxID=105231 RepID=A0A1Y1IP20_KLENI|nr:hypothetical protein KFL_010250040 [Klebsormidium nitens]|eukprot:GAQ92484.1 hypothetical protein KFL_010250040 [Klebsormidium nitens]